MGEREQRIPVECASLDSAIARRLKRDPDGLICAVIQHWDSRDVLMVGWMDDEALARTLRDGRVTLWSRSRGEYWRKGDTSGHVQYVRRVRIDCDGDAVLVEVDQVGAACHTGEWSCFDTGGDLPALTPDALTPDVLAPTATTVEFADSASSCDNHRGREEP